MVEYEPRRPERSDLHRIVREYGTEFLDALEDAGVHLPRSVVDGLERFLGCGVLSHGFLRIRCDDCRREKLLALSCKVRGLCPSCGAKSMTRQTAHIMDPLEERSTTPVRGLTVLGTAAGACRRGNRHECCQRTDRRGPG